MSLEYENVFTSKFTVYERLFDTDTQKSIIQKADVKPVIFTKSKYNIETPYKLLLNEKQYLEKHQFENEKEYRDFQTFQKQIGADTYGKMQLQYSHIRDNYFYNKKPFTSRIWYFDIEVRVLPDMGFPSPDKTPAALQMVQIYDTFLNKIIVLADQDMSTEKRAEMEAKFPNLIFKVYNTEKELYYAFYKLLEQLKPAIITAWNGHGFDFPYLVNRAKMIGINEHELSPVGNVEVSERYDEKTRRTTFNTKWDGITLLDMMDVYKKFTYTTQVSYSLENILSVELGEGNGKVDYGEFKNFSDFLHGDYDKFCEYGIYDAVRLNQLDQKMNLVELTRMIAYSSGINVEDALGTVKPWGIYINNVAYQRNLILPNDSGNPSYNGVIGGWVAAPRKGKHEWIVSFDFASLYPSIMRWNNMSPETYVPDEELHDDLKKIREKILYLIEPKEVEGTPWSQLENYFQFWRDKRKVLEQVGKVLKKHEVSAGTNGAFFRTNKLGIVPELVKEIYGERKAAKKQMFVHEKNIEKIKQELAKRSA